jgi:hypothetical protein
MARWAERVSGLPARFSLPIAQAAQGALVGVIGLYWDAWRHHRGAHGYWSVPHLLILWGLEAAVVSAALVHEKLGGPLARGERSTRRGRRPLLLVEDALNVPIVRLLAPGRRLRGRDAATMAVGGRVMVWAGTAGLTAFTLQVPLERLLGERASVGDAPHLAVVLSAIAATGGVLLLIRDAVTLARPAPLARAWPAIAAGALLVAICALWAPLETTRAGGGTVARAVATEVAAVAVLSLARGCFGRGAAVHAAVCFVAVRAVVAAACGLLPGAGAAQFAIPLGTALAVEATAALPAAVGGVAAASVGTLAAWGWAHTSLGPPLSAADLPTALAVALPLCALAATAGRLLAHPFAARAAAAATGP